MKTYGLLGHNIGYSLSPAMQNAALKKLGIDGEYKIFDIKPEEVDSFLNKLLRSGIEGLNVTVPYKQKAYDFVKKYGIIDDEAEKLGAVNTIAIKHKSLCGYNTDVKGFMKALKKELDFKPRKRNVFIFGAGGAGTACALKLARVTNKIFMCDLDDKKIEIFSKRFLDYFGKAKLAVVKKKDDEIAMALKECHLLVNATPFGRKKEEVLIKKELLHKDLVVMDLIYNPEVTPLMEAAGKAGIKAVNGLSMLLYQGASSLEIWTDKKAPVDVMREALLKELRSQNPG